jgi:CheY-like chemotaxis protein
VSIRGIHNFGSRFLIFRIHFYSIRKTNTDPVFLFPRAILLDIQLPEMDGYAVTAEFKKHAIIAVISYAYAMVGDRERILAAGATGYIEKRFNPETFVSEIASYLSENGDEKER